MPSHPEVPASYTVSVRQASSLPAASFRFHLTVDTLAVQLTVPLVGPVEDFHLRSRADFARRTGCLGNVAQALIDQWRQHSAIIILPIDLGLIEQAQHVRSDQIEWLFVV